MATAARSRSKCSRATPPTPRPCRRRSKRSASVGRAGAGGRRPDARLREDLRPIEGLDWITALRAPAIQALAAGGALQLTLFDQQDLAGNTHPPHPAERLLALM